MSEWNSLFSLYSDAPPLEYEVKDTGHGERDQRLAVIAAWPGRKLVIKAARNAFTTLRRVECWRDTIDAYRAMGWYCPRIVDGLDGGCARAVSFRGQDWVVYAEEFSIYQSAGQLGEHKRKGRYVYHDDAVRFLGRVGAARLATADFPSGVALLEPFCSDELYDEVYDNALEFKAILEERYPRYLERFAPIWEEYHRNKGALEAVYPALPRSVFQADLNETNVLLDERRRFVGVFDFNLCGCDTVLNSLFRAFLTDFYEDALGKCQRKGPYARTFLYDDVHGLAMESLFANLRLAREAYAFTEAEIGAAPLLYRYLRTFWWQPVNCLRQAGEDAALVERLLDWIAREQIREYDFRAVMA